MAPTSHRPRRKPISPPPSTAPLGVVSLVGLTPSASKALARAVADGCAVRSYPTPKALLRELEAETETERARSRLFVVNMPARTRVQAWLEHVRELDLLVPDRPIVVAVKESNNHLIKQALEAGADDWISCGTATDPALARHRLSQLVAAFARDHESFPPTYRESLGSACTDTAHTKHGPAASTHAFVARGAVVALPAGRSRERRTSTRRHTDVLHAPPRPATATTPRPEVRAEAPMSPTDASAAIERVRVAARAHAQAAPHASVLSDFFRVRVPHLRATSGRLDAKLIANALGLSLRKLAGLTTVSPQALSETPDSRNAQPALEPLARVLDALNDVLPAERHNAWLEAPSARWGDRSPREVILDGEAEAVAHALEILRDGASGQ